MGWHRKRRRRPDGESDPLAGLPAPWLTDIAVVFEPFDISEPYGRVTVSIRSQVYGPLGWQDIGGVWSCEAAWTAAGDAAIGLVPMAAEQLGVPERTRDWQTRLAARIGRN